MFVLPKHVQTSCELIKTSFRVWWLSFGSVWHFSFLSGLATIVYDSIFIKAQNNGNLWLATLLYLFCHALAQTVTIDTIHYTVKADDSYNPSFLIIFKKSVIWMMVVLMVSIAMFLGMFLFVIPGIIVSVSFFFAPYLSVIDDNNKKVLSFREYFYMPFKSLKESWDLVKHQWWFAGLRLSTVSFSLILIVAFFAFMIFLFYEIAPNVYSAQQLKSFVGFSANAFFYPLVHASMLTVIYDLQLRKNAG